MNTTILNVSSLIKEQENDNILGIKKSDIMLPKYNFELLYHVTFPSKEEWLSKRYDEQEGTKFFTDGSKTKYGTGCGIHGEFEVEQNLTSTATIIQVEAKVISHCAELIYGKGTSNKNIYIFSDSESATRLCQRL